jgi:hypothetical protein
MLAQLLDIKHGVLGRIPGIHQNRAKLQLLLVDTIGQHVMHVGEFRLAIAFGRINPEVNDPELVERRIHIDTRHHPDPFDQTMRIPAVLPPHQFNLRREVLVDDSVIEDHIPFRRLVPLGLARSPIPGEGVSGLPPDNGSPHHDCIARCAQQDSSACS